MATSFAKIKEQIAKLQKQADSIQSSVIARIKKEIAQHGLTAEHLFGLETEINATKPARPRATTVTATAVTKKASDRPAKYADDQGNAWGGMGKRPQWIRAALDAGRSLEEFQVNAAKPAAKAKVKAKATRARKPAATPAAKNAAVKKAPVKAATAPAKRTRKTAAPAKKGPARKASAKKAKPAATPAQQPAT